MVFYKFSIHCVVFIFFQKITAMSLWIFSLIIDFCNLGSLKRTKKLLFGELLYKSIDLYGMELIFLVFKFYFLHLKYSFSVERIGMVGFSLQQQFEWYFGRRNGTWKDNPNHLLDHLFGGNKEDEWTLLDYPPFVVSTIHGYFCFFILCTMSTRTSRGTL